RTGRTSRCVTGRPGSTPSASKTPPSASPMAASGATTLPQRGAALPGRDRPADVVGPHGARSEVVERGEVEQLQGRPVPCTYDSASSSMARRLLLSAPPAA